MGKNIRQQTDIWVIKEDGEILGVFTSKMKAIDAFDLWFVKMTRPELTIFPPLDKIKPFDQKEETIFVTYKGKQHNLYVGKISLNNSVAMALKVLGTIAFKDEKL